MPRDTYNINGYEVKQGSVKPHGNGARVLVPRDWIGEDVKIIKVTDQKSNPRIQPTAVIMYEEAQSQDGINVRKIMRKVVRYRNFTEINDQIVSDFADAIDKINIKKELQQKIKEGRSEEIQEFYTDITTNRNDKQEFIIAMEEWL